MRPRANWMRTTTRGPRPNSYPRGTTHWTYLGNKHTDFQGFVGWSIGQSLTGYFKIVLPAQGNYLGSSVEVKVG
jgi:hypothetical protein